MKQRQFGFSAVTQSAADLASGAPKKRKGKNKNNHFKRRQAESCSSTWQVLGPFLHFVCNSPGSTEELPCVRDTMESQKFIL